MESKVRKDIFKYQNILISILIFFSLTVLFFNLDKRSLWEPDEGRYAEISREMVESGDWLTPRLNYIKHFDKPPLVYWLIGLSFKFFGQSEFTGHLPLVIIGLGGILATFSLGKRLFGRRSGFLSAIILISSFGYPALSRVISTDIVFSFFCLLCYLFFIRKNYLLFYIFLAFGFMTKGPIILIVTLIPICTFLIYERQTCIFKEMRLREGVFLFALLGLPWFIYEISLNRGLLNDWIFQHTLNRIAPKSGHPFYFFIPVLIILFFPWICFLIPAIKKYLSFKRAPIETEGANMLLLFLWFFLPFLFFSCIGKKLIPYILPLLPPLAIMTARIWEGAFKNPKILSTKIFVISYHIFLLGLAIFLSLIIVFLSLDLDYKFGIAAGRPNIIVISVILACAIIASLFCFKLKNAEGLFWTIALSSSIFFLTAIDTLPKIETNIGKSIKNLALKIKEDLRAEDRVVNYRCFLKSLPFYLERRTIVIERQRNLSYEENPEKIQEYLLKDKTDLYKLLSIQDIKVYCITYSWEFKKIKKEYRGPLYLLDKAGKYVLFVNRLARR